MYMKHAYGARRKNSHAIEREKSPRVSKVKSLCTREFAVILRPRTMRKASMESILVNMSAGFAKHSKEKYSLMLQKKAMSVTVDVTMESNQRGGNTRIPRCRCGRCQPGCHKNTARMPHEHHRDAARMPLGCHAGYIRIACEFGPGTRPSRPGRRT